jgi:hypothetical protein
MASHQFGGPLDRIVLRDCEGRARDQGPDLHLLVQVVFHRNQGFREHRAEFEQVGAAQHPDHAPIANDRQVVHGIIAEEPEHFACGLLGVDAQYRFRHQTINRLVSAHRYL